MNSGTCSVIKIGKVSMKEEEIVENVVEGINGVVGFVSKMWEGIRSLHLRLLDSMALPLYQSVPGGILKIDGVYEVGESVGEDESEVEFEKKYGKSGKKKKGRICDVKYMDGSSAGGDELGSDGGDNERGNKNAKKRKKDDLAEEQVISEEGLEELGKKAKKVSKRERIDANITNESKESEKEEVGTKKKKKKGDAKKGLGIGDENAEKPVYKTMKTGDDKEEEKAYLPKESTEELARKKGKKKSLLATTEKKVKVSKK